MVKVCLTFSHLELLTLNPYEKGQIFHGTSTDKRHADTVEKLLLDNRKLREENNRLRRLMPSQLPGPTSSSSATEAEVARLWSLEGHLPSLFADEDASNLVYRLGFPSLNLDIAGDADDTTPPYELLDTLDDTLDDPDHLTLYLSESLESMAPYISRLLDLVFTHLGWLFAPVQRVHIARDHEALWIDGVLQVDYLSFLIHQEADTLSLYCSLLSVSILYIKQEELGFAIDPDRKLKQARKWFASSPPLMRPPNEPLLNRFNLSLRLLEHSHYMSSQPRITPLLTFCVLTSEFHTFGQAAYHDNMQAVMLRMGLALRLHRLSQAPRDPVKWTPEEETRRRCWSYLACREGMFLQPGTR